jgi:two-component system sensor histidine kinase DesK
VVHIIRQAATDVRLVANGYRNMSLAQEAAAAASLLCVADITVGLKVDCSALDDKVDTVLATVLREGVTNMLRHSTARNCSITASRTGNIITLDLTNDGVPRSAASGRERGGLENLAERLETVEGTLKATLVGDGRFCLLATVPVSLTASWPRAPASRTRRIILTAQF